ncbi:MAG: hypothetical protein ACM3X9_07485 [Bacillota bacterium]
MRVIFRISLFWIVFTITGSLVLANSRFQPTKTTLDSEWKEGETASTACSTGFVSSRDRLALGASARFYLQSPNEEYSKVDAWFAFPTISKRLKVDWNYQWNQDYYIETAGVEYRFGFWRHFDLDLKAETGLRNSADGQNSKYRYNMDRQSLNLDYTSHKWDYRFKFNRAAKDYPVTTYYTSRKIQLDQGIKWRINPDLSMDLDYQESTGEYPYDTSLTWVSWKEKWTAAARYRFNDHFQLAFKSTMLDWDQGFNHYRDDRRLEMGLDWELSPVANLAAKLRVNALNFYSAVEYYEPGDVVVGEDDLKSRSEIKLGVEYQYDWANFTIGIGYLMGNVDYKAEQAPDSQKSSFYSLFTWKRGKFTLKIKAAPNGDLEQNKGIYQVKLEYNPGKNQEN